MALTVTGPINITYSGGAAGPATTTQAALAAGFVVPTMPVGGVATFSAPVDITGTTTQSNTATVATPAGTTDTDPSNNTATASTTPVAPGCCLTFGNVVVAPNPVPAGTDFTVSARVTEVCGAPSDGGLADLTGLPEAITGESGQSWSGLTVIGFQVLNWDLSNTSNTALTVNANVHTTYPGTGCPADFPFSFTTAAAPAADLAVVKSISPATFTSGGTTSGTVTLVVTNNGPAAANGAILTDNIA